MVHRAPGERRLLKAGIMNKTKILMVDDQSTWTRLVRLMLERMGPYQVKEENRPENALATALEFRPDVILLDLAMPVLSGRDLLRVLRCDPRVGRTPVIFLSGTVTNHDNGLDGSPLLSKPVDIAALRAAVDFAIQAQLAPATAQPRTGPSQMTRAGIAAAAV